MKYLTTKNTWTDNPDLAKKFARMPDLDKLDSSMSVFKWQGKFIIGVDPHLQRNGGIFIRLSDGYYSGYPQPQLYGNPTSDKYSLKRNGPFMPSEVSNVFKTHTKMIPHHIAYARGMVDSLVKNPTVISYEQLPPVVRKKFSELAQLQRGNPELAMEAFSMFHSSIYSYMTEHIGDLIHRISEYQFNFGIDAMFEKLEKLSYKINNYDIESEDAANIKSNAKYRGIPLEKYVANYNSLLLRYASEHRKLPVYNEAQWLCREAAVSLGEHKIQKVKLCINKLALRMKQCVGEKAFENRWDRSIEVLPNFIQEWSKFAGEYELDANGDLIEYSPDSKLTRNPPSPGFDYIGRGAFADAYSNTQRVEIILKSSPAYISKDNIGKARVKPVEDLENYYDTIDLSKEVMIIAREKAPEKLKKFLPEITRKRVDHDEKGKIQFIYEMPFYKDWMYEDRENHNWPTKLEADKLEQLLEQTMLDFYSKHSKYSYNLIVTSLGRIDGPELCDISEYNMGVDSDFNIVFRDPLVCQFFTKDGEKILLKLFGPQTSTASLAKNPYNWSVDCSAMGQTPNHIEIGYMGAIVWMEPERFLDLCNDLPEEFRRKETIDWAQVQWDNGGLVAPPQLYVRKNDVSSDDPWKVVGHEGRHRATIAKLNNAKQIPVFIYFSDQYGRIQGNEITHDLVKSLQGPVLCESRAKKPSKFVWVDKYWLRGEIWDRFSLIPGPVLCPIDRKNTTIRN